MHVNLLSLVSAGMFLIRTVGLPGIQGITVAGIQGIGVSTPIAAEVAAATVGFAGDWHMPNGRMFIKGLLSMILAAGWLDSKTILSGNTTRVEGARPQLHFNIAPLQTYCGIMRIMKLPYLDDCGFQFGHGLTFQ
jgi:hypothetical protein